MQLPKTDQASSIKGGVADHSHRRPYSAPGRQGDAMKKILSPQAGIVLILLLIAMSALVAGIKVSVDKIADAALTPVAIFAVTLGYLLGCTDMKARRAWVLLILSGLLVIFIEASKLDEVLWEIIKGIPQFQLQSIQSLLKRETPNLSLLQSLLAEMSARASAFFSQLLSGESGKPNRPRNHLGHPNSVACGVGGLANRQARRRDYRAFAVPRLARLHPQLHGREVILSTGCGLCLHLPVGRPPELGIAASKECEIQRNAKGRSARGAVHLFCAWSRRRVDAGHLGTGHCQDRSKRMTASTRRLGWRQSQLKHPGLPHRDCRSNI